MKLYKQNIHLFLFSLHISSFYVYIQVVINYCVQLDAFDV